MAVRFRKYFPQCNILQCNGKISKRCPEIPKKNNGANKTCGVWCVEFFDDKKQWQSLTFKDVKTKSAAEKRLSLFIADRERGILNLPKTKSTPSLKEFAETYLALYKFRKEETRLSKKRAIKALVKYLGEYPLNRITPFLVQKYMISRKENDKLKNSSIEEDIKVLKHVFNTAIREGIVDSNPCNGIKHPKDMQKSKRVLTEEEIALIFSKLQGKDKLMALIGFFTGMRINEVLKLKWENIDFTNDKIIFTQSKSSKLITIPLSTCLVSEIQKYKSICTSENLFETREINHPLVSRYSTHFSKLFKQLGIKDLTFHKLRHSFTTILQTRLGIAPVVVKEMTGHSSLSMLQEYSHSCTDKEIEAIEKLTDYFINITGAAALPSNEFKTGTA